VQLTLRRSVELIGTAAVLTLGGTRSLLKAQGSQDRCLAARLPVSITEDSVGPLPVHEPLTKLLTLCPSAVAMTRYAEDAGYPALHFTVGRLSAVGSQDGENLQRREPASFWVVRGDRAELPLGVDVQSTWGQMVSAYGHSCRTMAEGEEVVVAFSRFPRLRFRLAFVVPADQDTFPATSTSPVSPAAHIDEVWILDDADTTVCPDTGAAPSKPGRGA
jgi:hypothetical protein